jgi:hypothetical protein
MGGLCRRIEQVGNSVLDPKDELIQKLRQFVEPALITLVALHIQEEKTYATVTFEDAVKLAEEKIAETRKILGLV